MVSVEIVPFELGQIAGEDACATLLDIIDHLFDICGVLGVCATCDLFAIVTQQVACKVIDRKLGRNDNVYG